MMYKWTPDMIRFMHDASEKTDYFKTLAKTIYNEVGNANNVCDAGCGLGQLANELINYYPNVSGIDINHSAVEYFKNNKKKEVFAVEADLLDYKPEKKYDLMVFNYFGNIEQILKISKNCCTGRTVIVKRNYRMHRFSFENKPINSFTRDDDVAFLKKNNITFRELSFSHEFGQPFKSIDDAVLFFKTYSRDDDRSLITRENIEKRLKKTNDEDFPFYMQHTKESCILII